MGHRYPRIAILATADRLFGRRIIRGVGQYARLHGPWELYFNPFDPFTLPDPDQYEIDGIIAHPSTAQLGDSLATWTKPIVAVGGYWKHDAPPPIRVTVDNDAIVGLIVDEFIARGFRRFGFLGEQGIQATPIRLDPFRRRVAERGYGVSVAYCCSAATMRDRWPMEVVAVTKWIESLETPTAIMAGNDECGVLLLTAARRAGRHVPDQIAVIAVDNNIDLCETTNPPMSSVDCDLSTVGFQAAATLARLMRGESVPGGTLVPPLGIVSRTSSEGLAIEDPEIVAVVRFIREQIARPISVSELLELTSLSRRAFEQRFRTLVGRSPRQEIERLQVRRAWTLLTESEMQIKQVARASGFRDGEQLARTFARVCRIAPSDVRRNRLLQTSPPV